MFERIEVGEVHFDEKGRAWVGLKLKVENWKEVWFWAAARDEERNLNGTKIYVVERDGSRSVEHSYDVKAEEEAGGEVWVRER